MRTKALLLAAAFAAAGVATSVAQVYSVNAVGYVNVTLTPGFNMVSNPLDAGATGNTIAALFSNITPSIPGSSRVYIFDNTAGSYITVTYSGLTHAWGPAADAARVLNPGDGVFFSNPSVNPVTATFVGEVKQGDLVNTLPQGFSIKASQVPQSIKPDAAGVYPAAGGDRVYRYNKTTSSYDTYSYSTLTHAWSNGGLPVIPVGEAFFAFRSSAPGTWTRSFNVNNPT